MKKGIIHNQVSVNIYTLHIIKNRAGQEWVVGPSLKARFWVLQSLWID